MGPTGLKGSGRAAHPARTDLEEALWDPGTLPTSGSGVLRSAVSLSGWLSCGARWGVSSSGVSTPWRLER